MDFSLLKASQLQTPAFLLDEAQLTANLQATAELCKASGCYFLFSVKALPLQWVIKTAADYVDGFSVSSLFEARLVREFCQSPVTVHLTTPGLRVDEIKELDQLCSHISFNSFTQMDAALADCISSSPGVRINPKLAAGLDSRYDPCRPFSKLGIDIHQLASVQLSDRVEGIHFHSMFGGENFSHLVNTIEKIIDMLLEKSSTIKWLNVGGGYLFSQIQQQQEFIQVVKQLKTRFGLTVFIEPGNAIVGQAGFLAGKVIDVFTSDNKTVAIIDSSVNHHPEVFEYQTTPSLSIPSAGAESVIIAGSTCLAGDVFGEYSLKSVPQVNDLIVFSNTGAYSLVKASRFNGYNLPTVYRFTGQKVTHLKTYDYGDFKQHWTTNG